VLDVLDVAGLKAPVVVADADYGVSTLFRLALQERRLTCVLALTGKEVAHLEEAQPQRLA
jgi:SRSO17 transposase